MEEKAEVVVVCDACMTEACIKGKIYCVDFREAGTMFVTKSSLIKRRKPFHAF